MNAIELATRLTESQIKSRAAKHSRPWVPSATPATSLGYNCERRIVYQRCYSADAAPISDELASIFEEGNYHQTQVRSELAAIGFEVVESEVNFRDDRLEITGTIDGKIQVDDPTQSKGFRRIPVEIKSTSGGSPTSEDQWRDSENKSLRRYYAQLQSYLFLTNSPEGIGLFKNKITGLWSCVAVGLDYGCAEGLLQKAERIRDRVRVIKAACEDLKESLLPDRIADRSECDGCPWKDTLCHPADAPVDAMLVSDDGLLLASLIERESLDQAATRFDKVDTAIKSRFKMTKGDRFVIGGQFLVAKKPHGKVTRIDIKRIGVIEQPEIT